MTEQQILAAVKRLREITGRYDADYRPLAVAILRAAEQTS